MRCPKCGYISFDRQKSCGKCSGDLTVVAEQVQGTGVNIVPPFFLGRALGLQQADAVGAAPFVFNDEAVSLDLGSLDDGDLPPEATEEGGDEVSLDLGSLGGGDLPSEATEEGGDEVSLDLGSLDDGGRSYGDEAGDDGQVDLDFAGAPVDEEEDNVPAPPILGLGDIDVSDLLPDQADETVGADSVREESAALSGQEGEEGEPASDELRSLLEKEDLVLVGEAEEPEPAVAADDAVVDLSSLVGPGDDFSAAGFEEDEADGPDFDFTLALDDFIEEGESDRDTPAGDQRLGSESEGGKGGAGGADTGKQARPVIADLGLSMERDSE
jgi:hypothetical protein